MKFQANGFWTIHNSRKWMVLQSIKVSFQLKLVHLRFPIGLFHLIPIGGFSLDHQWSLWSSKYNKSIEFSSVRLWLSLSFFPSLSESFQKFMKTFLAFLENCTHVSQYKKEDFHLGCFWGGSTVVFIGLNNDNLKVTYLDLHWPDELRQIFLGELLTISFNSGTHKRYSFGIILLSVLNRLNNTSRSCSIFVADSFTKGNVLDKFQALGAFRLQSTFNK